MIQLAPKDLYDKLEFDKILEILERYAVGEPAKEYFKDLIPSTNYDWIHRQLRQSNEAKKAIEHDERLPFAHYDPIHEAIAQLDVQDYVLPIESLQQINQQLKLYQTIRYYFENTRRQQAYNTLYQLVKKVEVDIELASAIDNIIDEEGIIKSNASPELQRIRRLVNIKLKEVDKVFMSALQNYRQKGFLAENLESIRNGRRVLAVLSEHKRKVNGLIHDESSTGKTTFIEPRSAMDINLDLIDLHQEEKQEIYRILKELTETIQPFAPQLTIYQDIIIQFDIIQAKTNLAVQLQAWMPELQKEPQLGFFRAYHPLLYLKNQRLGKKAIPFDLTLHNNNRILLISGPNAGGKSITLKAVGLLQLMVQSGMLIPADSISKVGIFKKIFVDMGDQQSLEDELSTYSARLMNMKRFLDESDAQTLVLIDEFGSGTDPKIGGAIAEAILNDLTHKNKVYGVITTHYSNLKIYAFKNKGILNGSMIFDRQNLTPTYELKVGRPGSSYAFEIAQTSGLHPKILEYARHSAGKNEKAIDDLLIDLQEERAQLADEIDKLKNRQVHLQSLIDGYHDLNSDLKFRRKKAKFDAKEKNLITANQTNAELNLLIKEIKEEKNLEKAKELAKEIKEKRQSIASEMKTLSDEVAEIQDSTTSQLEITEGGYARLKSGGATGIIEQIKGKSAILVLGEMKVNVKLKDLVAIVDPLEIQNGKKVYTDIAQVAQMETALDIRGVTPTEAEYLVTKFVDTALIQDRTYLKIIHGKGTGRLRQAVKSVLKEYQHTIKEVKHPANAQGGDGVTLIELG